MYLNPIEYCIKHMEQKPSQRKSHLKAGFDTHTESAQCLGAQHRKWNQRREPNAHIDVSKRHEFGRIRCIRYIASCNLSCVPLLLINSHGSHCAAVFYFQFWIFCFHLKKTVSLPHTWPQHGTGWCERARSRLVYVRVCVWKFSTQVSFTRRPVCYRECTVHTILLHGM